MAKSKDEVLLVGPGDIRTNTDSAAIFASTTPLALWSSVTAYAVDNVVEYSGNLYRAAQAGTNHTPSTSPTYWVLIHTGVKDGDIACVVAGFLSDLNIRQAGVWVSILNVPVTVSLPNNVSGQLAARFPISIARSATIQYVIQNGSAYRTGTLRYDSNGVIGPTGSQISDTNVVDVGGDVGIQFDSDVDGTGTFVEVLYTSTNLSVSPATMRYTIQKWS